MDVAEIIVELSNGVASDYCALAATVAVIYEQFITFDQEVDLFWKRKFTGATALFLANRYLILVVNIYAMLGALPWTDNGCSIAVKVDKVLTVAQYIPWAAFSGLRVYALCRNRLLGLAVLLLSLVVVGMNYGIFAYGYDGINVPPMGCIAVQNMTEALFQLFIVTSRACLIAADVVVILVTWSTLYRRGGLRKALLKNTLVNVFLRDGTIYFIILLVLNTLHLLLTVLSIERAQSNFTFATVFSEPFTGIIMSRFLLNLQAANQYALELNSTDTSHRTSASEAHTLVFGRVVGSIGSSLFAAGSETETGTEGGTHALNEGWRAHAQEEEGK